MNYLYFIFFKQVLVYRSNEQSKLHTFTDLHLPCKKAGGPDIPRLTVPTLFSVVHPSGTSKHTITLVRLLQALLSISTSQTLSRLENKAGSTLICHNTSEQQVPASFTAPPENTPVLVLTGWLQRSKI